MSTKIYALQKCIHGFTLVLCYAGIGDEILPHGLEGSCVYPVMGEPVFGMTSCVYAS